MNGPLEELEKFIKSIGTEDLEYSPELLELAKKVDKDNQPPKTKIELEEWARKLTKDMLGK